VRVLVSHSITMSACREQELGHRLGVV
jgi:hypothetical protein